MFCLTVCQKHEFLFRFFLFKTKHQLIKILAEIPVYETYLGPCQKSIVEVLQKQSSRGVL